jgi:hypothetical protein
MEFKMADINRRNLYLSTWLRYLRNSKGYKKVFMDAELSGPSDDLFQGLNITGRITEFKMPAVSWKYLYLSNGLRYLRNSKGYKKIFMDAERSGPSEDLLRGQNIPGRIMGFKMAAVNTKYLYISTGLRYLRNSKDNKKAFADAELSRPCDKLARGWSIPVSIMEFKMAAVNLKNLYLSTGLRYLRNSKGYNKVFMDAELSGPSDDPFQGLNIPGRIMEFKMAAVSWKYLYLSNGLRYLGNSKGYKKIFMDAKRSGPSEDLLRRQNIPGRIMGFKMTAVNTKYLYISTGLRYLRISNGSKKVLKYAELS